MTKKDYIVIAAAIEAYHANKTSVDKSDLQQMTVEIAKALRRDNPRFEYGKFLRACGFSVE